MRHIMFGILGIALAGACTGSAQAADLYPTHRSVRVSQGGNYIDRAVAYGPRIRVVEQLPYCGDCDAPIGQSSSHTVRLRYVGKPVWERGCALGGCYGYYDVTPSCYFRDVTLPNGHGGWVRGVENVCDAP